MSLVQKLLKYNVSRPIIVTPFWNWTFIIVTIIWVLLMFVLNIATSAYDLVPVLSPSYESTYRLWYQQIFPQTSWTPESWTCDPSFINILEGVSTDLRGYFTYKFIAYLDPSFAAGSTAGMSYTQTPLRNCSVDGIAISQPASSENQFQISVGCNTTAQQWFSVETGWDVASWGAPQLAFDILSGANSLPTKPLDINSTVELWAIMTEAVMFLLNPPEAMSILLPSVVNNNLSTLSLTYNDWNIEDSAPNTPAADSWNMTISYTTVADWYGQSVNVVFLPTGEVDARFTDPAVLNQVEELLAPATLAGQAYLGDDSFDALQFYNWIFVSYYWIFLADFGQTAPTIYRDDVEFSMPYTFPSTNNIFVNETLFEIYYSYLQSTVYPIFTNLYHPLQTYPTIIPPYAGNQLEPIDVTILRNYSCTQRVLKGWLSAAISVLVGVYTFTVAPYSFLIFILAWVQERRDKRDKSSSSC